MDTQSETTPEKSPSNKLKKGLLLIGLASVVGLGAGVFAANITVGTNSDQVEFGTGTAVISTCVDSVDIDLVTVFDQPTVTFYLDSINLVIVDAAIPRCGANTLMSVVPMDAAGGSLITVSPTPVVTFGEGGTTTSVEFEDTGIDADEIAYVTLETSRD